MFIVSTTQTHNYIVFCLFLVNQRKAIKFVRTLKSIIKIDIEKSEVCEVL